MKNIIICISTFMLLITYMPFMVDAKDSQFTQESYGNFQPPNVKHLLFAGKQVRNQ